METSSRLIKHGENRLTAGVPPEKSSAAMIMVHGRGAGAADILGLSRELSTHNLHYLAPQAMQNSWYPYRFIEPTEHNEPWLSSALKMIDDLVNELVLKGLEKNRIFLLGFSQGACLVLEYAVRNPARYAGIFGLSGGLIGPPGTKWDTSRSLQQSPVLLGCSDQDFHIPRERVMETADIMREMKAEVTLQLYPGMGHTVNDDEILIVNEIIMATLSTR